MDFAEGSFVTIVAEGKAAILAAEIVQIVQQQAAGAQETGGRLKMRLARNLTPSRWPGAPDFEVTFLQFTDPLRRMKSGSQGWNGVEIAPGKLVLLALVPNPDRSSAAPPLAVSPLQSLDDPLLKGVERALQIEAVTDPQQRASLLGQGLHSELEFLQSYSHFALGRLHRVPRDIAVSLELRTLGDQARPSGQRIASASNLELELWKPDDPDDRLNKSILSGLFKALTDTDPDLRRSALASLYRLLLSQAPSDQPEHYRDRLMSGVNLPARAVLLETLRAQQSDPNVAKEASGLAGMMSRY